MNYKSRIRPHSNQNLGFKGNIVNSICRRETGTQRIYYQQVARHFQRLSDVLPYEEDRMSVVLLGFSCDGENILGYREDKLLLWRIDSPQKIQLTTLDYQKSIIKPWLEVPFPSVFHTEDSQNELEVLQSGDASLLAIFCTPFSPEGNDEIDRSVAISLVPLPDPNDFNFQEHGIKSDLGSSTVANVFIGFEPENRFLVDLKPSNRHLLILNCGDVLRMIHTKNLNFSHSLDNEPLLKEESFNGGFPERIQIVKPSSDWWNSIPSLETRTSTLQHGTNLPCSHQTNVINQTSFEVEVLLNQLLSSQLRKLDGVLVDYQMNVIDPAYYSPNGNHHILIVVVAKIGRRFNPVTYQRSKRPRESKRLCCLIGVSLAVASQSGHVAVLKSVHLKPPPNNSIHESNADLKRLTKKFGLSMKPPSVSLPSLQSHRKGERFSNASVLRSVPISKFLSPTMPIGISLDEHLT
mmetsp:Transcript_13777/g.16402  ORF Transcript_13777/g.16402 Transcript_13777/m.16402 type:complete len:464 (+) Transcript_13777:1-1392(+)